MWFNLLRYNYKWTSIYLGTEFQNVCAVCLVAQSCGSLCDCMDCGTPGSSVNGILQARILGGLLYPSPGDLLNPGIKPGSFMSPVLVGKVFFLLLLFVCLFLSLAPTGSPYIPRIRLLGVPWTARRSNQSILKEISPEYSLEGLMLKQKLQYFGHLMKNWPIGKDPDAGKD